MICNELYNGQGLGNQLWNYAVARVLADRLGCEFSILGRERFKGKRFMTIDFGEQLLGGASPEGGPPSSLPDGISHYYRERRENLRGTTTDISRTDPGLLAIQPGTKFDGNCQSTTYLQGYRDKLRHWLVIDSVDHQPIDNDTCLIHIRGGDFAGLKDVFLSAAYYRHAMTYVRDQRPGVRFACVTDQPDLVRKLLPEVEIIGASLSNTTDNDKATHHQGGPVAIDFSLLAQAKYLIIPNSSFSWWAAYLNPRAEIIVAPKYWAAHNVSDGYWSTSDMITDNFTYLDRTGLTFSATQCRQEKDKYEAVHQDLFALPAVQPHQKIGFMKKARTIFGLTTPPTITERQGNGKIYDIFTFFNEVELLEMRLNILNDVVDYFVIVECTETFSGHLKPLTFQDHQDRFKKFKHKIIHYVVNDTPQDKAELRDRLNREDLSQLDRETIQFALTSDNVAGDVVHWFKEFYQKESIKKALVGLTDEDICFVSDVDEIWNPDLRINFEKDGIYKLRQDVYGYYLNNRSNEPWAGTLVTKYKNIRQTCLNHLRTASKTKYTFIKDGGWHFTNQGGVDRIQEKVEASYGPEDYNTVDVKSKIQDRLEKNIDYLGRHFTYRIDEARLPVYLLEHRQQYQHMFK